MARGPKVTPEERETVIQLLKDGKGRNEIAEIMERAPDTISRIAAEGGHVFGQTNEEKARARSAYCAEIREELRVSMLSEARRTLDLLRSPTTVYAFTNGGREGGSFQQRELDEPDAKSRRELVTSAAILIDKAELIDKNNRAANEDTGKGAMLTLLEAMGVKTDRSTEDTPSPEPAE